MNFRSNTWRNEFLATVLFVAFFGFTWLVASSFTKMAGRAPKLISIIGFCAGIGELMRLYHQRRTTRVGREIKHKDKAALEINVSRPLFWLAVGSGFLFLIVSWIFGFFSAAAVTTAVVSWGNGERSWTVLVFYSLVTAFLVWALFGYLLSVPLPMGALFDYYR